MKKQILYTIFLIVLSLNSFSQLLPSIAISAGGLLLEKINLNKTTKNIENYLFTQNIDGQKLTILRVPDDKIKSKAKTRISALQTKLDSYHDLYTSNREIDIPYNNDEISSINISDSKWPTNYYTTELEAYREYNKNLTLRKRKTEDSLRIVAKINTQRIADSTRLAYIKGKAIADSIELHKRKASYTKPKTINTLVGTSKTTTKSSGSTTSKSTYVKPSTPYRPASSPEYHRGSRGGCYFYNSNGNKQYVDRSLCN